MPRLSKTFLKLTSEVNPKLLSGDSTEKLKVFTQVLEQFERTRHSDRKKKYRAQLMNVFQHICLELESEKKDVTYLEERETFLEKRLDQKNNAVEKAQSQYDRIQSKLNDANKFKFMYEEQARAFRSHESDFSKLLKENTALESKLATAKKRIERLTKQKNIAKPNV